MQPKYDIHMTEIAEARKTGVLSEHKTKELAGAFLELAGTSRVSGAVAQMHNEDVASRFSQAR